MEWPNEIGLVFMPGLDGTGLTYGPLQEKMPANTQATVVSYPTDRILSYQELVQYAYRQLPENKPVVLIAESFSGPIAITLASSFPSNIRGVIFCATFARSPHPILFRTTKYLPLSMLFRLPVPDTLLYFLCGERMFSERLIPLFRQIERLVKPEVVAHRIRMLSGVDVVKGLRKLHMPCCYIQAVHDMIVPARCVLPFKQNLSNLVVKRVEGPHGILQAQPEECSQIIMGFVSSLTP